MSIEYCSNFKRAFPQKNSTRFEVAWCGVKGTDYHCGGYSDHCPPKMQKYFKSEKDIPLTEVTFKSKPQEIVLFDNSNPQLPHLPFSTDSN